MPTGAKLRLLGQFLRARDERFAPRHLAGEGSVDRRGGFDKGGLVSLIDLYPRCADLLDQFFSEPWDVNPLADLN